MIDSLRIRVAVATISNALLAADNFVGTWKRTELSQTEVWQPTPDGYKITATRRAENGNSITGTREIILDSKEHPNSGPGPKLRLTYTRMDANTLAIHGRDAVSTAGSFEGK
jgi:hypothetical protein